MEIERKWLINELPSELDKCESFGIEQGYLSTDPVIRVRKMGENYVLTVKGKGKMAREEYELPLSEKAYAHLSGKVEGIIIKKTRYLLPLPDGHLVELNHFHSPNEGLWLAEIEFNSVEEAENYLPPAWFGEDVTNDSAYHNANMSQRNKAL